MLTQGTQSPRTALTAQPWIMFLQSAGGRPALPISRVNLTGSRGSKGLVGTWVRRALLPTNAPSTVRYGFSVSPSCLFDLENSG